MRIKELGGKKKYVQNKEKKTVQSFTYGKSGEDQECIQYTNQQKKRYKRVVSISIKVQYRKLYYERLNTQGEQKKHEQNSREKEINNQKYKSSEVCQI